MERAVGVGAERLWADMGPGKMGSIRQTGRQSWRPRGEESSELLRGGEPSDSSATEQSRGAGCVWR